MPAEVHVADIGTAFRVTVYDETNSLVNLSGVTTKDIKFTLPDNSTITKTATLLNSGISGVMQYTSQSGDISAAGIWKIQGHVSFSGYDLYTNVASFRVYENLG